MRLPNLIKRFMKLKVFPTSKSANQKKRFRDVTT